MFKNMKLKTKLICGFLVVAAIAAFIGLIGFSGVKTMKEHSNKLGAINLPSVSNLLIISNGLEKIKTAQTAMLDPHLETSDRKKALEHIENARTQYRKACENFELLTKNKEVADLWKEFTTRLDEWRTENNKFNDMSVQLEKTNIFNPEGLGELLEKAESGHYKLLNNVVHLLNDKTDFDGGDDHTECYFGKWATTFNTDNTELLTAFKQMSEPHRKFHEFVHKIKETTKSGNTESAIGFYKEMTPLLYELSIGFTAMHKEIDKSKDLYNSMYTQATGPCLNKQTAAIGVIEQLTKLNTDEAETATKEATTAAMNTQITMVTSSIIGVIVAISLGILLSLSIVRPITRIIAGLTEGAEQVASASGQVSSASQSLAEGATEQAAGLEETSSSLEEMSSMTKQNADNAQQANTLATETRKAANNGAEAMSRMSTAIRDIQKSSDETAKIIKVIDEIAFQTNLLALNAAVEAARAGEAGKGFAVVAEEVRNLAMRSAEAAKNTANMIEESVKNSKNGVDIATEVGKVLEEIVQSIGKTTDLVGEIAAASSEQAQGIDQVNTAVAQMDKVTQQNAANAEESASASEELSAQAEQMNQIVQELVDLVGGSSAKTIGQPRTTALHKAPKNEVKRLSTFDHAIHHHIAGSTKKAEKKVTSSAKAAAAKAIPLEDSNIDDFKDFNA
ncbi:MAG: hypothetical protein A2Y12_01000 [Planctomycetes bacterium GWF2_42_9]|nr:MAG: hypothetical protein A2Y12_01000 [Planctomycetes bacterium GWF2_42_9]